MNHASKGIVFSLGIAFAAATGCSRLSVEDTHNLNSVNVAAPAVERLKLSSADLSKLQKYAEAYEPKSGRVVIPEPPIPNEEISQIISKAADADTWEHEKFVVLIFLRLSRFQIENFKQTYELGRTNPLTKEFYRLIGRSDYEKAEIMPAYLADTYVEENPHLRDYRLIDAEMKRIAKAGQSIKQELDRTTNRAKRVGN
jgi:hypothetical protein